MKKTLYIVLLVCGVMAAGVMASGAYAQTAAIELKIDKKIIHPELLGYNDNTALEDILQVLPELLNRNSGVVIANYSVQLDGKDVGGAQDAVLLQTRLAEIDCIEVTTSPTASQQTRGQGGTINVKLKQLQEGVSGIFHLGGTTAWDVQPTMYLGYKKNKLELRSSLILDYYAPSSNSYAEALIKRESTDMHRTLYMQNSSTKKHSIGQTAKLDIRYAFDERNTMKMWVMETCGFEKQNTTETAESHTMIADTLFRFRSGDMEYTSNGRRIQVAAMTEFEHKYRRGGAFTLEGGYTYKPQKSLGKQVYQGEYYEEQTNYHDFDDMVHHEGNVNIKSKHELLPAGMAHQLQLTVGVNNSYRSGLRVTEDSLQVKPGEMLGKEMSYHICTFYSSPFVEMNYAWNGFWAKAGVRYQYQYQHMRYSPPLTPEEADGRKVHNHDYTANLNLGYRINDHHCLRLMLARNIVRPSEVQAYPGVVIDWSKKVVYKYGNLQNMSVHNTEIDYVFDWQQDAHSLMLDLGLRYYLTNHLYESTSQPSDTLQGVTESSFYNGGSCHVGTIDLSLCYKYKGFSFAFSNNYYFRKGCFYYNFSLSPIYAFPREWYLAGRFTYYSRIQMNNEYTGDCFYAQLRLNKSWGKWNFYLEMDDIFDYQSSDKKLYSETEYSLVHYDLFDRALAVGISYTF